jgi:hypothetical protein
MICFNALYPLSEAILSTSAVLVGDTLVFTSTIANTFCPWGFLLLQLHLEKQLAMASPYFQISYSKIYPSHGKTIGVHMILHPHFSTNPHFFSGSGSGKPRAHQHLDHFIIFNRHGAV